MKQFLFLALVVFGIFSFQNFQKAEACSCAAGETVEIAIKKSSAVFQGKVIEIKDPIFPTSSADSRKVTFEITKFWKGPVTKNFTVTTVLSEVSCGYEFEENKEYLVYTTRTQGLSEIESIPEKPFEVSLCSRTSLVSEANEDFAELPQAHIPAAGNSPQFSTKHGSRWWSVFGILGVFGIAIFLMKKSE